MNSQKENTRTCIMCGSSPSKDPSITLHRFPKPGSKNALRCELWAKYSFPNESWSSPKFHNELYSKHKMLCSKHFQSTCFHEKKLFRTAVPGAHSYKDTISNWPDQPAVFEPVSGSSFQSLSNLPNEQAVDQDLTGHVEATCSMPNSPQDEPSSSTTLADAHNVSKESYVIGEAQVLQETSAYSPIDEKLDVPDELKICRICLSFNVKMYRIEEYNLCQMLYDITGIKVGENEGVFQNLCWECAARLSAASAFRDKALKSDGMLQRLLSIADTITVYEITTLKEKHDILQSTLTVQEAFYTTDIAENDPNNMNPNHMDIDDDELDDYYDTSQNYDRTNKLSAAVRTYTSKQYKNEDVVKTFCAVETVGNLTLRERSIKMNHDGSITIENNKITDREDVDCTDRDNLAEYKNNSKTLEEENLDKVVCCDLSTIEELDRKVIQRFKELKCCKLPELAKEFGLTAEEVQKIFDNAGLKKLPIRKGDKQKRNLPLRLNKELKKRVIALKNDGVTVPEIAKQTGVSRASIYKIWRRWCKENKVGKEMPDNSTIQDENIITQDLSEQNIDKTVPSSAEYIEDR